jgi:hypothetical protein
MTEDHYRITYEVDAESEEDAVEQTKDPRLQPDEIEVED